MRVSGVKVALAMEEGMKASAKTEKKKKKKVVSTEVGGQKIYS